MKKILFQGDSITDSSRYDKENPAILGTGYVNYISSDLTYEDFDCEVFNTGISGDRVVDLLARWKKDCLNIKPDYLTILIGVNDVWHELALENGVNPDLFEKVYRLLLDEVRTKLPDTKIILMGAYLTHGVETDGNFDVFSKEVAIRRAITERLADEYKCNYIDLQAEFDRAEEKAPASQWTMDGVHPTHAGHKLIALAWEKEYNCLTKI